MSTLPPYEELDHTADLALRARGRDLPELYRHAAQGLFALLRCAAPGPEAVAVTHQVVVDSPDAEALLVDWLNELLYRSEREQGYYDAFTFLAWEPTRLLARVTGHAPCPAGRAIKAATFSNLHLTRGAAGYEVVVTFDV
jgi:SHS2 domain-containing protein